MCPACPCFGMMFKAYGPHIPFWFFVSAMRHSVPEFGVLIGLPPGVPTAKWRYGYRYEDIPGMCACGFVARVVGVLNGPVCLAERRELRSSTRTRL